MADGLGGFGQLLKWFRASSTWATAGLAAVPFASALAGLSPPWPPGIVALTAVVQLLLLALVYLSCRGWSRKNTIWVMCIGIVLSMLAAVVYLQQLSAYTYQTPTTHERFVKGTVCTADARMVYGEECPALGMDALRSVEYEASRLWTQSSIDTVRLRLVALWLVSFAALAGSLGIFFLFQMSASRASRGLRRERVLSKGTGWPDSARSSEDVADHDAPRQMSGSRGFDAPDSTPPPIAAIPPPSAGVEHGAGNGVQPPPPPMPAEQLPYRNRVLGEDSPMSSGAAPNADDNAPPPDDRWINARIEDQAAGVALRIGQTYTLAFSVDAKADSNFGAGGSMSSQFPVASAEYVVTVQLHSIDFRIDDPVRTMRISVDGLSVSKARFDIVPLHEGAGSITATFLKDGNFVQQMALTVVAGDAAHSQPDVTQRRGRPLSSLDKLRRRTLMLMIEPSPQGGFDCTVSGPVQAGFRMPVESVLLDNQIMQLRAALMCVVDRNDTRGGYPFQDAIDIPATAGNEALKVLAEAGYALFQLLFRHDGADRQCNEVGDWLVRQVSDARSVLKLQIIGARFPVPWALLYPAEHWDDTALDWERFLGMRHVIEQIPFQNDMSVADVLIDEAGDGLSVSLNLNLDIDRQMQLDVVGRQQRYWDDITQMRPDIRVTRRDSSAELLHALSDPQTDDEILYLYCHASTAGLDDPGGPDSSSLRLDGESPLTLRSLKQRADTRSKLRGQPLVFINACESAELTPLFYSGFVPYFMSKGARGVIGTESRMPAQFAAQWAEAFFDALLAGKPLGETVLALRRNFLSEHGNPLGLLYGLHCNADTQVAPRVS